MRPQSLLPSEFRFHDHHGLLGLVTVDLLSISCSLCHPSYPRVLFCCCLGISAISVKLDFITGALHGLRFHELKMSILLQTSVSDSN
jgi:hypothetical protein